MARRGWGESNGRSQIADQVCNASLAVFCPEIVPSRFVLLKESWAQRCHNRWFDEAFHEARRPSQLIPRKRTTSRHNIICVRNRRIDEFWDAG